jgi:cold shock CspA family protein
MGKSQETFNKKEKEKKRLKKKKDKDQKKEDRKSSGGKVKSFDDMIAYVDEHGNITSTPPDPTRKKTIINVEDIQIGVAKQEAGEPEETLKAGTVTFFDTSKGYGFIKDHKSQESILFHVKGLIDQVKESDKVSFETEMGKKGLNAVNVKLLTT